MGVLWDSVRILDFHGEGSTMFENDSRFHYELYHDSGVV